MVQLPMETSTALRVFGTCGLVSVLVDLDHAMSLVLWRTVWHSLDEGRLLHPLFLIMSSTVLLGMGTYLGGLYIWLVLSKRGGNK